MCLALQISNTSVRVKKAKNSIYPPHAKALMSRFPADLPANAALWRRTTSDCTDLKRPILQVPPERLCWKAVAIELCAGCDYIECMPSPVRFSRFAVFTERMLFVDAKGRRFVREDEFRDVIRDKVLSLPDKRAYVIVDNDGYMQCPLAFREHAEEELKKQKVFRGSTIAELAEKLRIPATVFVKTIKDYNESVSSGNDRQFGRGRESMRYTITQEPFWAASCDMAIHHTMGGLLIDRYCRVMNWEGAPINGLYACGEVVGGIHGANRIGGNAITEAHVFGRIAGRSAVSGVSGDV